MRARPGAKDASVARAIEAMRANRPLRAEEICRDYLLTSPASIDHLRLLGHALLKQRRLREAEEQVRFALSLEPGSPLLHEDLGSVLAVQERYDEAIACFERAIRIEPRLPLAHKKLGEALAALGRGREADAAFEEYLEQDPGAGAAAAGAELVKAQRYGEAITSLEAALREDADNVNALRFLAVAYWRGRQRYSDAEALLRRATQLAPDFAVAWALLGGVLIDQHRYADSTRCYETACRLEPGNFQMWMGYGNACARAGEPQRSADAFARAVALNPAAPNAQMGHAHMLKTLGDQAGALKAYRAAVSVKPDFGEVWWSMANLKVLTFEDSEIAEMEKQVGRDGLSESSDIHLRFALGKAHEDRRDYDRAWHYYDTGNRRQRMLVQHDPQEFAQRQADIREIFSAEFLERHAGHGCEARDPIFIVGLPRSGSTLVEQILASHSEVEGTAELSTLSKLAASIGRYRPDGLLFPKALRDVRRQDWRGWGLQYMEETRRYRTTDRPYFTDKLPNNFPLVGLVHLILPNAKIINARRHPFDSCLGAYKQLFGYGQNFTYDMQDLAEYYEQYHATIQHWHRVLPGKVLDVHYEETVTDLEGQVRRILAHCGLPFEERCLRYYENERAVRTASSEQVRRPIYRDALGKWRRYESHLGLWKEQLRYIVDELPEVVRNAGL